jgi:hypothetical protein
MTFLSCSGMCRVVSAPPNAGYGKSAARHRDRHPAIFAIRARNCGLGDAFQYRVCSCHLQKVDMVGSKPQRVSCLSMSLANARQVAPVRRCAGIDATTICCVDSSLTLRGRCYFEP